MLQKVSSENVRIFMDIWIYSGSSLVESHRAENAYHPHSTPTIHSPTHSPYSPPLLPVSARGWRI